ncbi:MAG: TonB-dependent receptor, partial [Saprospiraceae bacterium]|nr:TonB-dependent receptor [Saprospiraceae bacterium]
ITLNGYSSYDDFVYNEEFGFDYSTQMGQITYRTLFSDKLFNRITAIYNTYESTQDELQGNHAASLTTGVDYLKLRDVLSYTPNEDLRLDAGFDLIRYTVNPGSQKPLENAISEIPVKALAEEQGVEAAGFVNLEYTLSPAFLISAGIRYNNFSFLGPETSYTYSNPGRPEFGETTGTESFDNGERIATYSTFEPRVSMRLRFSPTTSIKAGYSRTSQFINQLFNTAAPTPINQWKLSDQYIKPMLSHSYTLGVFRNFRNNVWETSIEAYYREIDQLFDFKDFANLNVNEQLETELLEGEGRSYGLELSIKKREGLVNGWLSYTYSKAERQVQGINRGEYYPSNFDIPHNGSLVVNIQPNQRNTLTFNFNYSRGRPTTYPLGNYEDPSGLIIPVYSDRNQLRVPDYHRLDIAYTLGQGYDKTKRVKTSWTFSVYNVYGRENAYSVFFTEGPFQQVQANRLAILGSAFPSITINFEFL